MPRNMSVNKIRKLDSEILVDKIVARHKAYVFIDRNWIYEKKYNALCREIEIPGATLYVRFYAEKGQKGINPKTGDIDLELTPSNALYYPCKKMKATSIVYDYLKENGYNDILDEYGLEQFDIRVQSAERTLIDKLYALGDYYISNAVREHSRHIYDIYKLLEIIELNDELRKLAKDVFAERRGHQSCRSAKDDIDMNDLLQEIIDKDVYKADYHEITEKILFDNIGYSVAIQALQRIVDSKMF